MLDSQKLASLKTIESAIFPEYEPVDHSDDEAQEFYITECVKNLCRYKNYLDLTWEDVAEVAHTRLGLPWKEGYYRRNFGEYALENLRGESEFLEETSNRDPFEDRVLELKKERVKLSDERLQNNAYIRRLAREDTIKEIALEYAEKMSSKKFLDIPKKIDDLSNRDAILCISDWHYGIEVDSVLNKFNPEICRERVTTLTTRTLQHCRAYKIKHLNLLNLGDLIAGRIHLTLRLESRFDVITQIMDVSEILAEMISELSTELKIDYYSCIDNHSRLEPKKTDSLELETLARITDWYLRSRLSNNPNVTFNNNVFGSDIITFKSKGHNIAAVHGDADSPTAAATSIARLTRDTYDLVLMAHRHHFAADELNETLVVSNSSLMGTDQYAFRLRLSAQPSQNLIVVSENNVTEAIHRIVL